MRLEKPDFRIFMSGEGSSVEYRIEGDLSAAAPPIRESKYLSREQCVEIYRWMLLNRRMEVALENLYKQGKVVGGVYFGLGQEGCSCASAYALGADDWLGPMIRNQGAMLVRGFTARRHHAAVHGQGRFADVGTRRLVALWRLREAQCLRADFDAGRVDRRDGRRLPGRAAARQECRRPDLCRRRRPVHRRHLREPELCRRAEAGTGAGGRK